MESLTNVTCVCITGKIKLVLLVASECRVVGESRLIPRRCCRFCRGESSLIYILSIFSSLIILCYITVIVKSVKKFVVLNFSMIIRILGNLLTSHFKKSFMKTVKNL